MPRACASAIVFRDGAVLLVKRARPPFAGLWSLPGGAIEPGENARQAAARELLEETGIEAELLGFAGLADVRVPDASGRSAARYAVATFFGRWRAGEAAAGSDAATVRWVMRDALATITLTEGTVDLIAAAAAKFDRA